MSRRGRGHASCRSVRYEVRWARPIGIDVGVLEDGVRAIMRRAGLDVERGHHSLADRHAPGIAWWSCRPGKDARSLRDRIVTYLQGNGAVLNVG